MNHQNSHIWLTSRILPHLHSRSASFNTGCVETGLPRVVTVSLNRVFGEKILKQELQTLGIPWEGKVQVSKGKGGSEYVRQVIGHLTALDQEGDSQDGHDSREQTWADELPALCYIINNVEDPCTGGSPHELMFNFPARTDRPEG